MHLLFAYRFPCPHPKSPLVILQGEKEKNSERDALEEEEPRIRKWQQFMITLENSACAQKKITWWTNCTWAVAANVYGIYAVYKVTLTVSTQGKRGGWTAFWKCHQCIMYKMDLYFISMSAMHVSFVPLLFFINKAYSCGISLGMEIQFSFLTKFLYKVTSTVESHGSAGKNHECSSPVKMYCCNVAMALFLYYETCQPMWYKGQSSHLCSHSSSQYHELTISIIECTDQIWGSYPVPNVGLSHTWQSSCFGNVHIVLVSCMEQEFCSSQTHTSSFLLAATRT